MQEVCHTDVIALEVNWTGRNILLRMQNTSVLWERPCDRGQEGLLWIICAYRHRNHPGLPCPALPGVSRQGWDLEHVHKLNTISLRTWEIHLCCLIPSIGLESKTAGWEPCNGFLPWCTWGGEVSDESGLHCGYWSQSCLALPPGPLLHCIGSWLLDCVQKGAWLDFQWNFKCRGSSAK